MRVTFVGIGQEQLAIGLLSAILKRDGHDTTLVFNPALFDDRYFLDIPLLARILDDTNRVVQDIIDSRPELIAFSVLTPTYQWSVRVARAVKAQLDVPVIFGGVHPSAEPEICLEEGCVDYVCVGEGEEALRALCDVLPSVSFRPPRPIPNLWWKDAGQVVAGPASGFIQDLDSLPYWDKEIWDPHVRIKDNWLTMASRGCPYRCTFCFNNFFAKIPPRGSGSYLRHRSIENVIGELEWGKSRFSIKRVDFEDDIFTTDRRWLKDFLTEYKREINLPFQCLVHPRYVDDDIAKWLRDAGCQHVQMGIQSADEDYKRKQLLRLEREVHVEESLASFQRAGVNVKVDHIFGLPGEPISAQSKALEIYRRFPPRTIQTFWLTHLPGVELTKRAVETGELAPDEYELIRRGMSGRFHSRSAASAEDADTYRKYEIIFRAIPFLPSFFRRRVLPSHVPRLPPAMADFVASALHTTGNILVFRDAEVLNYLRYYGHQLPKQIVARTRDTTRRSTSRLRPRSVVSLKDRRVPG